MTADRTVHGKGIDDDGHPYEVVRYDRAGAWWLEYVDGHRTRVSVRDAAKAADAAFLNRPGGRTFDRLWDSA